MVAYIEQNLNAQENILRALGEANASFIDTAKSALLQIDERNRFIDSLIRSFQNVDTIIDKCKKGIDYFKKLQKTSLEFYENICAKIEKSKSEKLSNMQTIDHLNNVKFDPLMETKHINTVNSNKSKQYSQNVTQQNSWPNTINKPFTNMTISNINENNQSGVPISMGSEISFIKPTNTFKKLKDNRNLKNQTNYQSQSDNLLMMGNPYCLKDSVPGNHLNINTNVMQATNQNFTLKNIDVLTSNFDNNVNNQ